MRRASTDNARKFRSHGSTHIIHGLLQGGHVSSGDLLERLGLLAVRRRLQAFEVNLKLVHTRLPRGVQKSQSGPCQLQAVPRWPTKQGLPTNFGDMNGCRQGQRQLKPASLALTLADTRQKLAHRQQAQGHGAAQAHHSALRGM